MDFAALLAEERAKAGLPARRGAAPAPPPPRDDPAKERRRDLTMERREAMERFLAEPFELSSPAPPRLLLPGGREGVCAFRAGDVPFARYVPEFVSRRDEEAMLAATDRAPAHAWTRLRRRALQNWGGTPSERFEPEPLPAWLDAVVGRLVEAGAFDEARRPNHVLLNRYRPGEGIAAHRDGPLYHPVVAILSLGAPLLIEFFASPADARRDGKRAPAASLALMPRSLFVFGGALFHDYWHEIAERREDPVDGRCVNAEAAGLAPGDTLVRPGTRVSLTCRYVPSEKK